MNLENLVPLLVMSSGRRISVFKQMRTVALELGQPGLVARIDRALAHDAVTRDYDNRWAEPTRRSIYDPKVQEIDGYVDICVSSIRDIALGHMRGMPDTDPEMVDIKAMLADLLPAGVAAVTSLPYVDQVAACEVILDKLHGRWAWMVTQLRLGARVALLERYTKEYRTLIDHGRNLTYATVRDYRDKGMRNLREVVVLAMAMYLDSDDPDAVAKRDRLLEPLSRQLADVSAHNRRRARGAAEDPGDGESGAPDDQPETVPTGGVDAGVG